MENLYFVCLTFRRKVEIGVTTEMDTLLRIRDSRVRAPCPFCRRTHEWRVGDAQLDKAA